MLLADDDSACRFWPSHCTVKCYNPPPPTPSLSWTGWSQKVLHMITRQPNTPIPVYNNASSYDTMSASRANSEPWGLGKKKWGGREVERERENGRETAQVFGPNSGHETHAVPACTLLTVRNDTNSHYKKFPLQNVPVQLREASGHGNGR